MIQHEIDHLDGVLILDRTIARAAQGGDARSCARRSRLRSRSTAPPGALSRRVRTVYLGTSEFAAAVLRRLAESAASAGAGRHPARPPARPRAQAGARRRSPTPPASSASRSTSRRRSTTRARRTTIAAARPEAVCVCAFGALITEPLLSRYAMLNVHPSLLPRWRGAAPIERAIMSRRRGHRRVDHARSARALDDGPVCAQADRADRAATTPTASLAARLRGARRRAARARARRAAGVRRAGRGARHLRPQDHAPRTASSMPARSAVELERVVRALTPHIGSHVSARRRHVGSG